MVSRRRRPSSASACWGGFIAATLLLLQLQPQLIPVAATPQLKTSRVGELAKRTLFETAAGHGDSAGEGEGGGDGNSAAISVPPALFSEAWEEQYGSGAVGCDLGRKRYYWRPSGLGSNILHLLNAFVYGNAVRNWNDLAIVSPRTQLGALECTGEDGTPLKGYSCLFSPMPHVCNFGSQNEWKSFMKSKGVSDAEMNKAHRTHWAYVRKRQRLVQAAALKPHGVDTFDALAVMARYLWKHLTPWLEEDVRAVLEERPDVQSLRQQPYVGFHIRRGDKVAEGEAKKVETKEYLSAAFKHLEDREGHGGDGAKDIKGIWVAADSQDAVREVRALAPDYFPNVSEEAIIWISGGGEDGGRVHTHSKGEKYSGFVLLFADWKMLSTASVFVGTFTSNVSRVVALLREGIERKARDSSISVDEEFALYY